MDKKVKQSILFGILQHRCLNYGGKLKPLNNEGVWELTEDSGRTSEWDVGTLSQEDKDRMTTSFESGN